MFILYLLGNVHFLSRISDLGGNNGCLLALQAPSVLNGISDGTRTPPQISLAWVKKLDVCNNECHQDFVRDY